MGIFFMRVDKSEGIPRSHLVPMSIISHQLRWLAQSLIVLSEPSPSQKVRKKGPKEPDWRSGFLGLSIWDTRLVFPAHSLSLYPSLPTFNQPLSLPAHDFHPNTFIHIITSINHCDLKILSNNYNSRMKSAFLINFPHKSLSIIQPKLL